MLIEQQEELKQWLTSHLEPLCDADPAALAKYVLALIKKDKPVEELKDSMIQQMDVFLQSETTSFVDMLFKVVETKEYANSPQIKEAEKESVEPPKTDEETVEPKIEADSTTPIRDYDKYTEARPAAYDERKRFRTSPPRDRRMANRLGPRDLRDPPRRFRSRSRSLSPRHDRFRSSRRRSRSPNLDRRRRSPDLLPRRGRSLDRERNNSRDSTPTRDEGAAGYTPTAKKPRCRDYDEKGFCLRGDLCKFDHGTDAVVLEDSAKTLGAPGYQPGAATTEPYVPGVPVPGIPFPPPVLTVPPPGYPQYGGKRVHEGGGYEPPAKRFDYARLGRGRGRGRGGRGGRGGASTMLAVRNIPTQLNTITHLNGHFSRYGNLVNVQVQFEGDPGSALVTFSENDEANAAFSSSEAVMNNRFIKVFWHMDKGHVKERLGQHNANMVLVHGDRLTKTVVNDEAATVEGEGDAEKVKEDKAQAILAIQKNQEMLQTKHELLKQAEEKRKTAMIQQEGLLKSKHDLLDGLIEQQKALIVKLEKGKGSIKTEEKAKIMKLLKELSSSIDRTKEDIKTSLSVSGMKNRTKAEIQKELLDAEMELFTKQQDGGTEVQQIQQKVNNLRIEAARSGLLPTSRPPRGRGNYRGRARGFSPSPRGSVNLGSGFRGRGRGRGFTLSPGNTNLDRRPSRILVSGYELEEKDEIVTHFTKFGEIVDTVHDEVTPSIILKFKTRRFAEAAMATGKNFLDKSLTLSWYNQATPDRETGEATECSEEQQEDEDDGYTPPQEDYLPPGLQEDDNSSQAVHSEGNGKEEGGEELNENLLDDEDEDGEDEERSWKRRNNEED